MLWVTVHSQITVGNLRRLCLWIIPVRKTGNCYLLFQRKIIWHSTNLKEVLLCFFTFWILVSVVCMFGHKTIYKVTNPVQRENYNKRLVWTNVTELFSWLAGGYNTWLSTACFKIETRCGCFYITVFLMETSCFQNILNVILISSFI